MTEFVDIQLPASLWLAKLTPSCDPAELLTSVDHCAPASWFPTPLSTGIGFGGILSLSDVGAALEPNLTPTGSLPLPGDRIIITRTGRKVEAFGAVEVTSVTLDPRGGTRIGHRPLLRFDQPVDLRSARATNYLLDDRWDGLFGTPSRDRRLVALADADVALCFTAFGFSLEALFDPATAGVRTVEPIECWGLDEQIGHITITSELAAQRIADGVVVYHGAKEAFALDAELGSVEVSSQIPGRDLLLSHRRDDLTYFTVVQSLCLGETFRMDPTYRHLITADDAATLVAVETETEWSLVYLNRAESDALHAAAPEGYDDSLRELGLLDR